MKLLKDKRFRYGTLSTAMMLFAVVIFVLVNLLADEFNMTRDLTNEQIFSLTSQSRNFLRDLDREVHITYITRTGNEEQIIASLLDEYMAASGMITVERRDPNVNPLFVHELAARAGESSLDEHSLVVESRGRITVVTPRAMLGQEFNWMTGQMITTSLNFESEITRAVHFVSQGDPPVVYFVTGSGESGLTSQFVSFLESENFVINEVNPIIEDIPEDADILFIPMPARDFTDVKADRILEFLQDGGNAYFALGLSLDHLPNLSRVIGEYGMELEDFIVIEGDSRRFFTLPFNIFPVPVLHEITENLHVRNFSNAVIAPAAIRFSEVRRQTLDMAPLWLTSPDAFGRVDMEENTLSKVPSDVDGPFILAAWVEDRIWITDTLTRVVVTTSAEIAHPELVGVIGTGNWQFIVNAFRWMEEQPPGIWIPNRTPPGHAPLVLNEFQVNVRVMASMGLLPLSVIAIGAIVWYRRRHS